MQGLPLVIVGASAQGRVALEALRAGNEQREVAGFVDDDESKHGARIDGLLVIGGLKQVLDSNNGRYSAFIAIGNNDRRCDVAGKLRAAGIPIVNIVHPRATVMADVILQTGVLICAGAVVVAGCSVANDVVINTCATVDHDSLLSSGVYLAPGVHGAGRIKIGEKVFVGVGSALGPGITIGDEAIVGAGSVVLGDIPPRVIAWGAPARVVRHISGPVDWRRMLGGRSAATQG